MDDDALTRLALAQLGRVPGWAWRPDGPVYAASEVGLFYGAIDSSPDQAVGALIYGGSEAVRDNLRWRRMQLTVRGRPEERDGANRLASIAMAAMAGLELEHGIVTVSWQSLSAQGIDARSRQLRTDNYIILFDNQESHP